MSIGFRKWATRGLHAGDLTALSVLSNGALRADQGRIERLKRRGFVAQRRNGRPSITARGRAALAIKRLTLV
jgi:hypothetical protein